ETSAPPPERSPRSGYRPPAPPRRRPVSSIRRLSETYATRPFLTPIIYGPAKMVRPVAIGKRNSELGIAASGRTGAIQIVPPAAERIRSSFPTASAGEKNPAGSLDPAGTPL